MFPMLVYFAVFIPTHLSILSVEIPLCDWTLNIVVVIVLYLGKKV